VVFEKVIQEVCDSSQVDFEESGVDQQTLHNLREVSIIFPFILPCPWSHFGLVDLGRPKAERSEVREAVLMGEHRLYESPFICAAVTRFGVRLPSLRPSENIIRP
jgi:hypothetical protein